MPESTLLHAGLSCTVLTFMIAVTRKKNSESETVDDVNVDDNTARGL